MPRWEKPRILQMDALPTGLGHCADGSTPTSQACADGQNTGAPHYCSAGGQGMLSNGDGCDNGGLVLHLLCITGDIFFE